MFARLEARGIAAGELARVEAPVGIAIGSESPAECAVSILGSIIRDHRLGAASAGADAVVDREREPEERVS